VPCRASGRGNYLRLVLDRPHMPEAPVNRTDGRTRHVGPEPKAAGSNPAGQARSKKM